MYVNLLGWLALILEISPGVWLGGRRGQNLWGFFYVICLCCRLLSKFDVRRLCRTVGATALPKMVREVLAAILGLWLRKFMYTVCLVCAHCINLAMKTGV